jgi:DNA (cytosine-5)-methyltransferase 1
MRPRLLDLFCGAGGAGMGYYRAGFDVVGVDHVRQSRYPFEFVQADALEYVAVHGHEFDAIHASPPCQRFSRLTRFGKIKNSLLNHPDLIEPTRAALQATGKPYVIENVVGAPLCNPIMLCGTMFGLRTIRHRLFECGRFFLLSLPHTPHRGISVYGPAQKDSMRAYSSFGRGATHIGAYGERFSAPDARIAMDVPWMTNRKQISQAIPPAYTEFIGRQLMVTVIDVTGREYAAGPG